MLQLYGSSIMAKIVLWYWSQDFPNHLANMNYAICFRIENGYCGIKYMQPASDIYSFTLSGDATICKSGNLSQFSVTRLGDFRKVLMTNVPLKEAKKYDDFLG